MDTFLFDVIDDSGFLALVDPDAYAGFVGEEWEPARLLDHFAAQMRSRRLLVWGTGMENEWRVQVQIGSANQTGFREIAGTIDASAGRLLVTSYESLTMAAQFEDVTLPEPHERDRIVRVAPGRYRCRIIQLHDHADADDDALADVDAHYVVELLRSDVEEAPWPVIPWTER